MIAASSASFKMSSRKSKSPGWAAFDLKQRQKEVLDVEIDNDPFPAVSRAVTSLRPCQNFVRNNNLSVRSFSSMLRPVVSCSTLTEDEDNKNIPLVGNYRETATQNNKLTDEPDRKQGSGKLKVLHSWAEESLINDVMAAVDNDVNKASALLEAMVSSEIFENKTNKIDKSKSSSENFSLERQAYQSDSFEESTDLTELRNVLKDCLQSKNEELANKFSSCGNENSDFAASHMTLIMGHLRSLPVEPELEEDDIYLIHRKDAIRMMRSASHHSRLATEAYLRGDHFSAQKFSKKAREEWMEAERLNARAAKEILSLRNSKKGLWELDLHGLHAVEAIKALQERLDKLETQVPFDRSVSPNRNSKGAGILHLASLEPLSSIGTEKLDGQCALARQRQTILHVITGRGSHSRGQAALPAAVKNFLNENGYRYDEARPGLITVRPKFRRQ